MLRLVRASLVRLDREPLDTERQLARQFHRDERGLVSRLVKRVGIVTSLPPREDDATFVPLHLERIAETIELMAAGSERMAREGTLFTDRAMSELRSLLDASVELLEGLRDALRTGNRTLIRYVKESGRSCELRANEYALFHEQRLIEGVGMPRASSVYLAILDHVLSIEWHARQIAERLEREPVAVRQTPRRRA